MCNHILVGLYTGCMHLDWIPQYIPTYIPPEYCGKVRREFEWYHGQPNRLPVPEAVPIPTACPAKFWSHEHGPGNIWVAQVAGQCPRCAFHTQQMLNMGLIQQPTTTAPLLPAPQQILNTGLILQPTTTASLPPAPLTIADSTPAATSLPGWTDTPTYKGQGREYVCTPESLTEASDTAATVPAPTSHRCTPVPPAPGCGPTYSLNTSLVNNTASNNNAPAPYTFSNAAGPPPHIPSHTSAHSESGSTTANSPEATGAWRAQGNRSGPVEGTVGAETGEASGSADGIGEVARGEQKEVEVEVEADWAMEATPREMEEEEGGEAQYVRGGQGMLPPAEGGWRKL